MTIRSSFILGLIVALAAHVALVFVVLLVVQPFTFTQSDAPPAAAPGGARASATLPDDLPIDVPAIDARNGDDITDADLMSFATSITQQVAGLTDAQRQTMVSKLLPLAQRIDPQDLDRMTGRIERLYGVTGDRAYAPREGVSGPIDVESIMPYRAEKLAQPDGSFIYRQTWVDKDGRSMQRDVASAEATLADRLMYQSGQDKTLGTLMQTALRIADQMSQARTRRGQPSTP